MSEEQLSQGEGTKGLGSIGKYQLDALIGEGGQAKVYKAHHVDVGKVVAIKVLHEKHVGSDELLQRFKHEAMTACKLNHPNLCQVFDYGFLPDGQPYMVMEYLEGETLSSLLKSSGALHWTLVLDMLMEVADGLSEIHEHGIIHRDIKPGNIMFCTFGAKNTNIKLLDFGLAKDTNLDESITRTGGVIGTISYMSPEQCLGAKLDARTDIYALGCVGYEAVSGKRAFDNDSIAKCIMRHLNEMPPPFDSLPHAGKIPEALEAVVFGMLAKDPAQRYDNCKDLLNDLRELKGSPDQALKSLVGALQSHRQQRAKGVDRFIRSKLAIALGLLLIAGCSLVPFLYHKNTESLKPSKIQPPQTGSNNGFELPSEATARTQIQQNDIVKHEPPKVDLYQQFHVDKSKPDLNLANLSISDKQLEQLVGPRWSSIDLADDDITDKGLEQVGKMTTLKKLVLNGTRITDTGFRQLASLRHLSDLSLERTKISDQFGVLGDFPQLTELHLAESDMGDHGLGSFPRLRFLAVLDLERTKVTDAGLPCLSFCPIGRLYLSDDNVSDRGLKVIGRLNHMWELALSYTKITDAGLQYLSPLPDITKLAVDHTALTDEGCKDIGQMRNLRYLRIDSDRIGDEGAKKLASLTKLNELSAENTQIGNLGAKYLSKLPFLRTLSLDRTLITDDGVAELSRMPLDALKIRRARLTEKAVSYLSRMKSLHYLGIQECGLSESARAKLKPALPQCNIEDHDD